MYKETRFHLSHFFLAIRRSFFPVRREFRWIISVSERQLACGIMRVLPERQQKFFCMLLVVPPPPPSIEAEKRGGGEKMSNEAQYFAIFYLKKEKENKRCDVNRNRCDVLYRRVSLPLDRCEQYTLECTILYNDNTSWIQYVCMILVDACGITC